MRIKSVPERSKFLEGNIRWDDKKLDKLDLQKERGIDILCKSVVIRPLAGSASPSLSYMVCHEKIPMNAQIAHQCTATPH